MRDRLLPFSLHSRSALAAFHDVVCVSFNYRTGPLGWMAFHEDVDAKRSTGNWGILDIQSALAQPKLVESFLAFTFWLLAILSMIQRSLQGLTPVPQGALRWVQKEVAAFGGDASRVAIHGQSSGAGAAEHGMERQRHTSQRFWIISST